MAGDQVAGKPLACGRAELVACETCGGVAPGALTRGEQLLAHLRAELGQAGDIGIDLSPVRCLWVCKKSCAVLLRSSERVGYVIAELTPSADTARALLEYAQLYLNSADGAVPFRTWPPALKGHFHCRIPRLPAEAAREDAAPRDQ